MKAEEDRRLRRIEKEKIAAEEKLRSREDDGKRDDLTVLIMNLSLKASERDVWRFLTEKAGKVADIQLIKCAMDWVYHTGMRGLANPRVWLMWSSTSRHLCSGPYRWEAGR
ncbi:MAG: uncharacterized protein KVP18_003742 [Porospora cf. gigantea A]|uniref:uncharacterized protein n=1 Tax=Porospora cf. gigantea A TaxID=2853593 RepID=UPI0035598E0A|nr:MAG: hypothetical protein KVP18_003742 [Porospora cf. gigantea A]